MADIQRPKVFISGPGIFQTPDQPAFQGKPSFVQRLIEITIALDPNQGSNQPVSFAGTNGANQITLSGFRTSVRINNYGAYGGATAEIRIYGLQQSTMNQLSALGQVFNRIAKNSITVSAGDSSGLSAVFGGTIMIAMPDYNSAPDVPFIIQAQSAYLTGVVPIPASSFPQSTDVATIMSGFANQMGLIFENNGVTIQVPPTYLSGTLNQQIRSLAEAAHINADVVDAGTRLAIWPIGGSRSSKTGQNIPLISKTTGMINYPTVSPNGFVIVNVLFNPLIGFGGLVQIQSADVPLATGTWVVTKLDLELDSLIPRGQWKETVFCYPQNLTAGTPPQAGT